MQLKLTIAYGHPPAIFELDVPQLGGTIDPRRSQVNVFGTKVEVQLKKHDASVWPDFAARTA